MRILIIGGHVTPALAVIEALPKNAVVLYAGRKYALEGDTTYSLEYKIINSRNIPFAAITTGRLQRIWTKHTIPSLFKLPLGFFQAFHILKSFRPTVIMGFGGYVQIPLCIAGRLLGIPIVIHEQTLDSGLANKIIAPLATRICASWETSSKFFPRTKTILTGNPAISTIAKQKSSLLSPSLGSRKEGSIVIVGGSLGSHAINTLISQCVETKNFVSLLKNYSIIHQTGDAKEFHDFAALEKTKTKLPVDLQKRYILKKFIDPKAIIEIFQQADLVISRAGINTVTTLLMLNKPALFIPLPVSQHNEQKKNALFFKDHGLGEIAEQQTLTSEKLLSLIHIMLKNRKNYYNRKDTAELMLHKNAARTIINILSYVEKNSVQTKA